MAPVDTDVLIIGAGPSGLGLAIQLLRKLGSENFRIIEKSDGVAGTWHANSYPGCGCDVMSHFYSFSFALKPDWTRMYSMQPEIKSYFETLADNFRLYPKISFGSSVETAVWDASEQHWLVSISDHAQKTSYTLKARAVVSGVGSLSVPKPCSIPGADSFEGKLFHSAHWDHSFDWTDKSVVVIGNGCSATQFVPVMARSGPEHHQASGPARQIVQFSRQAHYLAERDNGYYSNTFQNIMRYIPLAMRLYRFSIYASMESDFAGFHITGGQVIRDDLARENEAYVKKTAPEKYWDFLIPRHQIGCKRKVLDTDYLASLWRPNMELVPDDPISSIVPEGVRTQSGRLVAADAIVLATGFQPHRLLSPMKITGEAGLDLEQHWKLHSSGSPAAYLGTVLPDFPNFFMLMGPNTLTGHASVIYTSECQILLVLGLLRPILAKAAAGRPVAVAVTPAAAHRDIHLTRERLRDYVWSSGCTSWALDPETRANVAMYWHYQWHYYLRCLFLRGGDFEYRYPAGERGPRSLVVGFGWTYLRRAAMVGLLLGGAAWAATRRADAVREMGEWVVGVLRGWRSDVLEFVGR